MGVGVRRAGTVARLSHSPGTDVRAVQVLQARHCQQSAAGSSPLLTDTVAGLRCERPRRTLAVPGKAPRRTECASRLLPSPEVVPTNCQLSAGHPEAAPVPATAFAAYIVQPRGDSGGFALSPAKPIAAAHTATIPARLSPNPPSI